MRIVCQTYCYCKASVDFDVVSIRRNFYWKERNIDKAVLLCDLVDPGSSLLGSHGGLDLLSKVLLGIADHLEPTGIFVET